MRKEVAQVHFHQTVQAPKGQSERMQAAQEASTPTLGCRLYFLLPSVPDDFLSACARFKVASDSPALLLSLCASGAGEPNDLSHATPR